MRTCTKCGEAKPLDQYYMRAEGYLQAWCKRCCVANSKRHRLARHEYWKEWDRQHAKTKRSIVRDEVFKAYGGYKCACCGETEPLFLTIDHIENNGAQWRRETFGDRSKAGYRTYAWLKKNKFPSGYQVLCMNCNHGKRMNNGICPHTLAKHLKVA